MPSARPHRNLRRLRTMLSPILETAGAAVLGWYLAKLLLSERETGFAPIAAVMPRRHARPAAPAGARTDRRRHPRGPDRRPAHPPGREGPAPGRTHGRAGHVRCGP